MRPALVGGGARGAPVTDRHSLEHGKIEKDRFGRSLLEDFVRDLSTSLRYERERRIRPILIVIVTFYRDVGIPAPTWLLNLVSGGHSADG